MTTTPQFRYRKVIVEHDPDGGFMAMDDDGDIITRSTASAIVQCFKARDERAARRGESTATLIEWINVPDGFVPPAL